MSGLGVSVDFTQKLYVPERNVKKMRTAMSGETLQDKEPVTCYYHWLQYHIECERRAEDADSMIHPTTGRGHSNLYEAHFTVLPDYCAKDQNLCR